MKQRILKLCKISTVLMVVSSIMWYVGLNLFASHIPVNIVFDKNPTDAIVVLTGAPDRISEGLKIFRQSNSKKLLISGVGKGVTLENLTKSFKINNCQSKSNIVLGTMATSTITNAYETKIFMEMHDFNSLRLITSNYHMPRTKLLFKHILPNKKIIYYPIFSKIYEDDNVVWRRFHDPILIISEYNKYLMTFVIIILDKFNIYWDLMVEMVASYIQRSFLKNI